VFIGGRDVSPNNEKIASLVLDAIVPLIERICFVNFKKKLVF